MWIPIKQKQKRDSILFYPTSPETTVQEIAQWGNLISRHHSQSLGVEIVQFLSSLDCRFQSFPRRSYERGVTAVRRLFILYRFFKPGGNSGFEKPCL